MYGPRLWLLGGPIALECFVHISDKRIPARLKWSSNVFNHFDCGSYNIRGYNAMISFPFRYLLLWEFKGIEWNILGTWWNMMGIYLSKSDEVSLKTSKKTQEEIMVSLRVDFDHFAVPMSRLIPGRLAIHSIPRISGDRHPRLCQVTRSCRSSCNLSAKAACFLRHPRRIMIFLGNQNFSPWSIWLSHAIPLVSINKIQ